MSEAIQTLKHGPPADSKVISGSRSNLIKAKVSGRLRLLASRLEGDMGSNVVTLLDDTHLFMAQVLRCQVLPKLGWLPLQGHESPCPMWLRHLGPRCCPCQASYSCRVRWIPVFMHLRYLGSRATRTPAHMCLSHLCLRCSPGWARP